MRVLGPPPVHQHALPGGTRVHSASSSCHLDGYWSQDLSEGGVWSILRERPGAHGDVETQGDSDPNPQSVPLAPLPHAVTPYLTAAKSHSRPRLCQLGQ